MSEWLDRLLDTDEARAMYLRDVFYHALLSAVRASADPIATLRDGIIAICKDRQRLVDQEIERRMREPAP